MKTIKIDGDAIDFFSSLPDEVLSKIAFYDWEALERLCMMLTLDLQLIKEEIMGGDSDKELIKN